MSEDAFEKWSLSGKKEVNIEELADFANGVRNGLIRLQNPGGWSNEDVRNQIESEYGTGEIALSGVAKIVKGGNLAVALNNHQFNAIEGLYDLTPALQVIVGSAYIMVSDSSEAHVQQAKLVWLSHSSNHEILISQGLAKKLAVEQGDIVKLLDAGSDLSNLDLDTYFRNS